MSAPMTLNYFDLSGRAEATRLALAYAGKDFEDKRLTGAEYGASKWAGKGLPVLEVRIGVGNGKECTWYSCVCACVWSP